MSERHIAIFCGDGWGEIAGRCVSEGTEAVILGGAPGEDEIASELDRLEENGAGAVALIGAGKAAEAALLAAGARGGQFVAAVITLSPPMGRLAVFDVRQVTCPKLVIMSEFDAAGPETREIFGMMEDPRKLTIYPGEASGADIAAEHGESMALELADYLGWAFAR